MQIPTHLTSITALRSAYGSSLQLTCDLNSHAANLPERVRQTLSLANLNGHLKHTIHAAGTAKVIDLVSPPLPQQLGNRRPAQYSQMPTQHLGTSLDHGIRPPLLIPASTMGSDKLSHRIIILWGRNYETKDSTASGHMERNWQESSDSKSLSK